MSVAKVVEITAESTESFDDAIKRGINRANKTLKNVRGAWVAEQKVEMEGGQISVYRVNLRVSFILE
ncbi:MAG TPA: dodecin family protein [Wenzhouxiangella sp.]|nr:dodecin family protein [Wenzhouxiangella sp.]